MKEFQKSSWKYVLLKVWNYEKCAWILKNSCILKHMLWKLTLWKKTTYVFQTFPPKYLLNSPFPWAFWSPLLSASWRSTRWMVSGVNCLQQTWKELQGKDHFAFFVLSQLLVECGFQVSTLHEHLMNWLHALWASSRMMPANDSLCNTAVSWAQYENKSLAVR